MIKYSAKKSTYAGYALVSVLWLVTLLSVMATGLAYANRHHLLGVSGIVGGTQARYLADGATQLVIANLLSDSESSRLLADGETIALSLPGGTVEVTVQDEYGKVDINRASTDLLRRLLYSFDLEPDVADPLADAIADYRDEDDLKHLNGAEDEDYIAAELGWESRDAPFTETNQLRNVLGMTEEIFLALRPNVTVYSRQPGVNPEVAPLQVLIALSNMSPELLGDYIEQRRISHREGLPMPPKPQITNSYNLSRRGVVYFLGARSTTNSSGKGGLSTVFSVRRSRAEPAVETLAWQAYVLPEVTSAETRDNLDETSDWKE